MEGKEGGPSLERKEKTVEECRKGTAESASLGKKGRD